MEAGRALGAALGALALLGGSAHAETDDASWTDRLEWRAIAESETAIETRDGELQKWDLVLEPELQADLGWLGRLTTLARIRIDPADELEPGRPTGSNDFRSPPTRRLLLGDEADLELRELYLDSYAGEVFLRLGKQQIVWGQADGLRVLDLLNPLHFREFILPEFEDRRIPLWMAQAEAALGPVMVQLVWIPDHTYDDIPEAGSTYAFTSSRIVPAPPPAVVGPGPVLLDDPSRPEGFVVDDDYGVRATAFLGGWDLSANYLFHYQDQPVLFRRPQAGGGVLFAPRYERTHVAGGSASNAFGDFTLRTEAAYSSDRFFLTNAASDADGVFRAGELGYVLGLDYQYDADLLVSGQLFQSVLAEAPPSGATRDQVDTTVSLLARKELRNDTVRFEALWLQSINDGDGLLQAEVSYQWRSNVILRLGGDLFYGDGDGLFGQFDPADRITFGVEIGI